MNAFGKFVDWAEERLITSQAHDKNGFVCNIVSELGENIQATNEEDELDSVCDICVFVSTELPKLGFSKEKIENLFLYASETYPDYDDGLLYTTRVLLELQNMVDNSATEDIIINILMMSFSEINSLGYDISLALEQTFLEIDSRKGTWNDELKKWKKFTTEEYTSKWIKADYTKAKI